MFYNKTLLDRKNYRNVVVNSCLFVTLVDINNSSSRYLMLVGLIFLYL